MDWPKARSRKATAPGRQLRLRGFNDDYVTEFGAAIRAGPVRNDEVHCERDAVAGPPVHISADSLSRLSGRMAVAVSRTYRHLGPSAVPPPFKR
jgi:hypothetical protein